MSMIIAKPQRLPSNVLRATSSHSRSWLTVRKESTEVEEPNCEPNGARSLSKHAVYWLK